MAFSMRPKRSRTNQGSSSAPTRTYNHKKFVSAEAADRFDTVLAEKILIPERGLAPNYQDGEMLAMIRGRNWSTFVQQPDSACTAIVKEFYANAQDTPACEARVRGQTVSFSRDTINHYYGLQPPAVCEYSTGVPDYDQIIQQLTQPGTTWAKHKRTEDFKHFPNSALSRYGKVWFAFLCAKLMPCLHLSTVSKDRAKLLYAIITEQTIDVGSVIEASIRSTLRPTILGGLPHPSLITELCRTAGVQWGSTEPLSLPISLLDHALINRYEVPPGSIPHPRGLGYSAFPSPTPSTSVGPSTSAAAQPPSMSLSMARMTAHIEALRIHQNTMQQNQQAMMRYASDTNVAWTRFFSQLYPNADMSYFPPPPTVFTNPPAGSNEEDDET